MTPDIKEIIAETADTYMIGRFNHGNTEQEDAFKAGAEWAIEEMAECMEWAEKNYQNGTWGWHSKFYDGSHGKSHISPKFYTTTELITMFLNQKYKK